MLIEIFSFKYGESLFNTRRLFHKDERNDSIPFSWLFYLIKNKNKFVLVDAGFSTESYIEQFEIKNYENPLKLLEKCNIQPKDITDLIITHTHFDHFDNIDKFPNATIYIQSNELEKLNKYYVDASQLGKQVISFDDTIVVKDTNITVIKVGGHTAGSSIVKVNIGGSEILITGDEAYLYETIVKNIPIGTYYDLERNRFFIDSLNKSIDNVFTFHDPSIVPVKEQHKIFSY